MPFVLLLVGLTVGYLASKHSAEIERVIKSTPVRVGADFVGPDAVRQGVVYAFIAQANEDAQNFALSLAEVGASLVALAVGPYQGTYQGFFVWQGDDFEPVEDLPTVRWVGIQPVATTGAGSDTMVAGTSVGLMGYTAFDYPITEHVDGTLHDPRYGDVTNILEHNPNQAESGGAGGCGCQHAA